MTLLFVGEEFSQAREFAPSIGRFITRDPWEGDVRTPLSLNRYIYAKNNPVILVDPTGKLVEVCYRLITSKIPRAMGAYHCYIRIGTKTWAFYPEGVRPDKDPEDPTTICITALPKGKKRLPTCEDEERVRENVKWDPTKLPGKMQRNWRLSYNCCHWVEDVLNKSDFDMPFQPYPWH